MKILAAVFQSEDDVRRAYTRLQDVGVSGDDIGIVMRESVGENRLQREQVRSADAWVGSGVAGVGGGLAGGLAGWAATAGLAAAGVTIPVVGPVLAVGALVGLGALAGHGAGWMAGELAARGLQDQEARFYESAVERGEIVMTVNAEADVVERVRTVLRSCNGKEYQAV
jgi:hypothetical protein